MAFSKVVSGLRIFTFRNQDSALQYQAGRIICIRRKQLLRWDGRFLDPVEIQQRFSQRIP